MLHFNDVYNIAPRDRCAAAAPGRRARHREPVGGAARFVRLVDSYRAGGANHTGAEPLVLFSGDVFSPSVTSTVTKGVQMIPVLNAIRPAAALYGKCVRSA